MVISQGIWGGPIQKERRLFGHCQISFAPPHPKKNSHTKTRQAFTPPSQMRFFCDRASLYLIKVQNMDRQSSEREFKCGSSCVNGGGSVSDWKCGLAGRGLSVSARKTVVQMNKPRACIHSYFHCNTTTTIASICVLGYFHKLFPFKSRLLWAAGLFFQLVFFLVNHQ